MENSRSILLAVIVLAFQGLATGQSVKAEVRSIDAYVEKVEAFVEKYNSRHLTFADISDHNQGKLKWKMYNSETEFAKARETVDSYNVAYVWRRNGQIVMSNFVLSSASGDWVKYIYLYFRE